MFVMGCFMFDNQPSRKGMIMRMKNIVWFLVSCLVISTSSFAGSLDLKIKNLEFDPKPAGVTQPKIKLDPGRSYRVIVTIQKSAALPKGATFIVRTECIRSGKSVILGESRVGEAKGWNIYACYDIYPAEAGMGDGTLRTTIDAENEIIESDESPASNVWDRQATVSRP
jgi:hypothetical protein